MNTGKLERAAIYARFLQDFELRILLYALGDKYKLRKKVVQKLKELYLK